MGKLFYVIYWDNNATTPLAAEVFDAMAPYLKDVFFNPSAGYACARRVREAVEEARADVAALLGVTAGEIVFTSGGTEATNMAFRQMLSGKTEQGMMVLATDHDASLKTAAAMGHAGICPVDAQGRANPAQWAEACASGRVAGVSFALANNETGVLQDAATLCATARSHGLPVHVDCVQCVGKMPINLRELDADYASVSAHKFHGPKGIGCLFRRAGVALTPLFYGGGQEFELRSGTENVAGIIGFGVAARLAMAHRTEDYARMKALRDGFEVRLAQQAGGMTVHSAQADRIPNTSNIAFDGCTAEALMLLLEPQGILCSVGSACHTLQPRPSHVLEAMGLSDTEIRASLRFSLSWQTTADEVDQTVAAVTQAVKKVRGVQSSRTGPVLVYKP